VCALTGRQNALDLIRVGKYGISLIFLLLMNPCGIVGININEADWLQVCLLPQKSIFIMIICSLCSLVIIKDALVSLSVRGLISVSRREPCISQMQMVLFAPVRISAVGSCYADFR